MISFSIDLIIIILLIFHVDNFWVKLLDILFIFLLQSLSGDFLQVINESINLIWILLLKLSFRDVGGYELLQFGMVFVSELFE